MHARTHTHTHACMHTCYVLLLQHPSDLDEVTSRENANLSTIKTGSIIPREIVSLSLGCPGPRFGSGFGYE